MAEFEVFWPVAGRHVMAVSGGADSMVMLDVLASAVRAHKYELIVAHFDHGLRPDSHHDARFVSDAALRYGLVFEHQTAQLGRVSEATARAARHAWLEQVRVQHGAKTILTAHHQDDLLETSLLNLARGSGRLGLAPMQTSPRIGRPFLNAPRAALRAYAAERNIAWREDSTNADIANPRNLLRHNLLAFAKPAWRASYLENVVKMAELNTKIDQSISVILTAAKQNNQTYQFAAAGLRNLPVESIQELLVVTARKLRPGIALDRSLVQQSADFILTGRSGKYRPLRQGVIVYIRGSHIIVTTKAPD